MKAVKDTFYQYLKIPNRGLEWLIYHNLYIALGAIALTFTTYLLLDTSSTQINWALLLFIFCATIFTYNIDRVPFYFNHWFTITLQLAATIGIITCSFWLSWQLLLFIVHLGFIAVFYSIPKGLGWLSWLSLRRIPLLKIFLIAYGWAAVTVILPVITLHTDWQAPQVLYLFTERFLFIFIITLPFDIGDVKNDQNHRILTIPVWLGIKRTRQIGYLLIMVYMATAIGHFQQVIFVIMAGVLMFSCGVFLRQVNAQTPRIYYKKYVDGAMFLYFALFSFV
ncbi:UbiA family prenyltransferase [uncultured Microscilla sp.]|uniref:UbiA family prenyltransferase n=1 Tax=uncultured Microscilla sp. TaxID=432653 RepID=UPI00262D1ABB|nr:UbiA family prenyltransferase [uncultured Microscilla sp.]